MTDETKPDITSEAGADEAQTTQLADALSAPAASEAKPAREPKTEAAPEAKPAKPSEPFWYRKALKEKEDRVKALEREAAELRQRSEQPSQPQYDDPDTRFLKAELRISERFARREHGSELFEETRDWLAQRPDMEQWALGQDDPWEAAISTYKREKLVDEMGSDPDKWREGERARIRAEIEAEFGAVAHHPQAMSGTPRIPTAAASARSAGHAGGPTGPTALADALKRK